jgi:DNA mismatch endonuclease, patch repair protein
VQLARTRSERKWGVYALYEHHGELIYVGHQRNVAFSAFAPTRYSTEWRLRSALVRAGIRGWTLNAAGVIGKPDFVLREQRVVVSVDGCFWHGCPKCKRIPSSNTLYWVPKFDATGFEIARWARIYGAGGWNVLRVWELELANRRLGGRTHRKACNHMTSAISFYPSWSRRAFPGRVTRSALRTAATSMTS